MTSTRQLLALVVLLAACGGTAAPPPAQASTLPPTSGPTATLEPTPTAPTTPPSTASATPTSGPAISCRVDDVITPQLDYERHAETALDWTYALPPEYVPHDLVSAAGGQEGLRVPFTMELPRAEEKLAERGDPAYDQLLVDDPTAMIRSIAYPDLAALRAAAAAAGLRLVIVSAYRSYARQEQTFDYWVRVAGYESALMASARPGHSEHQLGTTIDFGDGRAAPWEYDDWATTPTGAWLRDNAAEFGFVMSYPLGKTDVTCYQYEPWHYRWVGRDLAKTLEGSGRTLREYQAAAR